MDEKQVKNIIEAALLVSDDPLTVDRLVALFAGDREKASREEIRAALAALAEDYADRGIQLKEVASGFRVQASSGVSHWMNRLWEERSPRYSRALLETIAIMAYRQPITRGEIEDIRGVAVSTNIMRTLLDREWVRVAGHRDVPGHPAVYTTTRQFLDYFNLKSLSELPSLKELRDLSEIHPDLFAIEGGKSETAEGGEATSTEEVEALEGDEGDTQPHPHNEGESELIVIDGGESSVSVEADPLAAGKTTADLVAQAPSEAELVQLSSDAQHERAQEPGRQPGQEPEPEQTQPTSAVQSVDSTIGSPADSDIESSTAIGEGAPPGPDGAQAREQDYLDEHLAPTTDLDGESEPNGLDSRATDWGEEAAG